MKNLLEERAYMALLMTMEKQSDRELLELAAMAAGIDIKFLSDGTSYDRSNCTPWNPMTDDGDALRLVVKLKFHIDVRDSIVTVEPYVFNEMAKSTTEFFESSDDLRILATRRAIVRAAAEIGRRMQDEQSTAARG